MATGGAVSRIEEGKIWGGKAPTAGRRLAESERERFALKREVASQNETIDGLRAHMEYLERRVTAKPEAGKDPQLVRKVRTLEREIDALKAQLAEARGRMDRAEVKLVTYRRAVREIRARVRTRRKWHAANMIDAELENHERFGHRCAEAVLDSVLRHLDGLGV